MERRAFLAQLPGAVFIASGFGADAQGKVHRVVWISPAGNLGDPTRQDRWVPLVKVFLAAIRELGYVEGRDLRFEAYSAEGVVERITEIAARVLRDPVDVIVATGGGSNEVAQALKRMTASVPIVLANSSDPVEQGLVASLARPGGNITGFVGNPGPAFEAKRLQLLKNAVPDAVRIAYLGLKADWESPSGLAVRAAAAQLGQELHHVEHVVSKFDDAFSALRRRAAQGLFVARNPWNFSNRRPITDLAAELRMAAVYPTREYVDIGGLMSYGPSLTDIYRRVAGHVDKILRGASPATLPVEQPTKFELVVNNRTAAALDIAIPQSTLVSADKVIE